MNYHNSSYWEDIHKQCTGQLRAVGHSHLSEKINKLKYSSETESVLVCLNNIIQHIKEGDKEEVFILDVGAGIGYWSSLIFNIFNNERIRFDLTALDISQDALVFLKNHNPQINTLQRDLKAIDREEFLYQFDLVISFYCLHHLVNLDDFLNALRFAAKSVTMGGFLMIMDPILTLPFSICDVFDFPSYQGSGVPRHLYLIEDILHKEGFEKKAFQPAVSFLLNGPIEGNGRFRYLTANFTWHMFCKLIYKKNRRVQLISRELLLLDRAIKKLGFAYSSSIGVYEKTQ